MSNTIIPYGKQHITDEDINEVVAVLRSEFITQGPKIAEFEKLFADYVGSKYAVAVSNGTTALHLSVLALGLDEAQRVITTPITFAASANCIRYCGGEVFFVDIDPDSYLIDLSKVEDELKQASAGKYRGIIVVDFAGKVVDLEHVKRIANEYNLWIIEDACHAPGGFFIDSVNQKQFAGNCAFADIAIFSFHPVKHIATGEGGMITTNDIDIYHRLIKLRTHGITRDVDLFQNSKKMAIGIDVEPDYSAIDEWPGWYMEMQELGYNYRLTDFQAALGISQLARAEAGIQRRREVAENYYAAFKEAGYIKGQSGSIEGHAYHLYIIEVEDRLGLYNYLRKNNVHTQIHYFPCHLMPYYRKFGWNQGDLPFAENYYSKCISLPMFPTLTDEQQSKVITLIENYYR